uniref:Septin-type G domain-containing protein n=1 Tax=Monodelphis domestica TaxID=13616 RepID=A0A5F8GAP6_MONDO
MCALHPIFPLTCSLLTLISSLHNRTKNMWALQPCPSQLHRKSVKKGFDFTLMVAGESGLGKSTLINSLFLTDLYKDRLIPDANGE